MKKIVYSLIMCLSLSCSLSGITNIYEFKNIKTNQRIFIVGLTHTYGNEKADSFISTIKQPMAQRIIAQINAFKKANPENNLDIIYEYDDTTSDLFKGLQDPIVREFIQSKTGTAYDPRSEWSEYLEGYRQMKNSMPTVKGSLIRSPSSKEILKWLEEERVMISSWKNIDQSIKEALLASNKQFQKKLRNTPLAIAFFDQNLDKELLEYDLKVGDYGFYEKIKDNPDKTIIMLVGGKHAEVLKDLLTANDFTLVTENVTAHPPANQYTTTEVLSVLLKKNNAEVEKGLNNFLLRLAEVCAVCFKPKSETTKLSQCSRCKQIKYCSQTCQKEDWKRHKKECQKCEVKK